MPGKNADDIKDLFSDKFRNYEEDVNDSVWKNIEGKLHPRKKRKMLFWWAAAASVAGLITIYSLLPKINDNIISQLDNEPKTTIASKNITTVSPEDKPEKSSTVNTKKISEKNVVVKAVAPFIARNENKIKSDLSGTSESPSVAIEQEAKPIIESSITEIPFDIHNTESLQKMPLIYSEIISSKNLKNPDLVLYKEPPFVPFEKSEKMKDWAFAANLLSATGAGNGSAPANETTFDEHSFSLSNASVTKDMSTTNIEYSLPLITSITAHRQLNKRWGIESGISYSVLKATSESSEINNQKNVLDVQLIYLGIPLMSTFGIIIKKRISFYSAQGIFFESGIAANYNYSVYRNSQLSSRPESIEAPFSKQPMGSLLFGIGLNYKFTKHIGFYLQPDMAIYLFRTRNPYNVRNTKIFWPSLQTGLRLHF